MTDRPDPSADPWAVDPTATQRTPVPDPTTRPVAPPPNSGATGTTAGTAPAAAPAAAPSTPAPTGPGWSSPPARDGSRTRRRDDGRIGSIVFGLILVALGVWFFIEQTLGFDLPELRWDELWPLILIAIGLWVVLGARRGGD